jgi:hypothetical protein
MTIGQPHYPEEFARRGDEIAGVSRSISEQEPSSFEFCPFIHPCFEKSQWCLLKQR